MHCMNGSAETSLRRNLCSPTLADEVDYEAATAPLWSYLDQLKPLLWRRGRAFPENSAARRTLLSGREISIAISFNPAEATSATGGWRRRGRCCNFSSCWRGLRYGGGWRWLPSGLATRQRWGVRGTPATGRWRLSNKTALAMVFKLAQAAEKTWRRLNGHNQLPKLIQGVKFIDGIEAVRQQPQAAA